jgi:signal-transduction protein with cAMP-binding, CBS, and nucleotidyltransferase domain
MLRHSVLSTLFECTEGGGSKCLVHYDLLEVMVTRGINQIPVVQDGRLVGLLSRESILRYLQVRQSVKMDEPRYAL